VDLLEELAVAARQRGGHPLITLTSDRLRRRMIADVPARFDRQPPLFDLTLAKTADVLIAVEANDEAALVGLPAERMVAQQKAAEGVYKTQLKRSVRAVMLGNGLYPAATRAKRFKLTETQLRRIYEAGLGADSSALQKTGAALQTVLSRGKELHLTGPGTDLKLKIETRPVLVSDGVLTPDKVKKGGAAVWTWLPAGEVYVTPVPGTGDGKVLVPVAFWEGQLIRKLELSFKGGKLVVMTAESGLDRLQTVYKAAGDGKDQIGAIDIGINPAVVSPRDSLLVSYVAAGTVTIALGNNTWAGGDNGVHFGLSCHLPGCTLNVDGKAVVEEGKLAP